jgi:hypothetical protein
MEFLAFQDVDALVCGVIKGIAGITHSRVDCLQLAGCRVKDEDQACGSARDDKKPMVCLVQGHREFGWLESSDCDHGASYAVYNRDLMVGFGNVYENPGTCLFQPE